MKFTPRNEIGCPEYYSQERLIRVDTLYEIADAELSSIKSIVDLFDELVTKKDDTEGFRHTLLFQLESIDYREKLRVPHYGIVIVANRIIDDWKFVRDQQVVKLVVCNEPTTSPEQIIEDAYDAAMKGLISSHY